MGTFAAHKAQQADDLRDPLDRALRSVGRAEARIVELEDAVKEAVVEFEQWRTYETRDIGEAYRAEAVSDLVDGLRAMIDPDGEA